MLGVTGGVDELEGEVEAGGDQSSRVQAVVDYYGPSDFVLRSQNQPSKTEEPDSPVRQLLGVAASENKTLAKFASPAFHVTQDDPPLLIIHGDQDKTVYLDQSERMVEEYRKANLDVIWEVVPGAGHGGSAHFTPFYRKKVADFLRSHLQPSAKPRLVILTDIGGDPDDTQSMIRLMTFANEFEIEGLIASASGTPGELKRKIVRPDLIRQIVEAYGKVRNNLISHAPGYPTAQQLLGCIHAGNPRRGRDAIGDGHDTDGSRWIIRAVGKPDPRPVNIAIWGGQTDLAQALWRIRQDRGESGLTEFIHKIRVHDISDQDGIQPWIYEHFSELFYVLDKAPQGVDNRRAVFRGMYLGGSEPLTSREWVDLHVRHDHGPLGALYPPKTWTAPNPHSALKEGDTPSWFYFLPTGLSDPSHPEWGGWGGRFRRDRRGLFRDAEDRVGDEVSARATVWRWRPAFQNAFQARMDWCVLSPDEVNHAPTAVLNDDVSCVILTGKAKPRSTVRLSAVGSSDQDGDSLSYRWWVYREPSTYSAPVHIEGDDQTIAILQVPQDARGKTIHVVLEVTDDGTPPLTSYRRSVLGVE
jgi:hypothetical protein